MYKMADNDLKDITLNERVEMTNTTFLNEQQMVPVEPEVAQSGPIFTSKQLLTDVAEGEWNVADMLGKPMIVASFDWTTTNAEDTHLPILPSNNFPNIPYDFLVADQVAMQSNVMKSYVFARFNVVFDIQVNLTKFHCGELWIGYMPTTDTAFGADFLGADSTRISMFPHVKIDAANSNDVSLRIPWFNHQSHFNQTYQPEPPLGCLFAYVFAPLQAAQNSPSSARLTMWMHFEDAQLHVPINPSLTFFSPAPPTQFLINLKKTNRVAFMQMMNALDDDDMDNLMNEAEGLFDGLGSLWNNVTSVVSSVGSAFDKAVNLDFEGAIGDAANAISSGMSAFEQGAEIASMFDRPINLKADLNMRRQVGPMQYGIGSDTSTRLDITPFSQYRPNTYQFSGFHGDHGIHNLIKKYVTVARLDWATTQTSGTQLWSKQINPTTLVAYGDTYPNPWIQWVAKGFTYWTGTIVFRIKVCGNQFHTGRLNVQWQNGFVGSADLKVGENFATTVIDLKNTEIQEHEIECRYNATTPWLLCNTATLGSDSARQLRVYSGTLKIFVQIPLIYTEGSPTTLKIRVDCRAGDDFRLWQPTSPPDGHRASGDYPSQYIWKQTTDTQYQLLPVRNLPLPTPTENEAESGDLESEVRAARDSLRQLNSFAGDHYLRLTDLNNGLVRAIALAEGEYKKQLEGAKNLVSNLMQSTTRILEAPGHQNSWLDIIDAKIQPINEAEALENPHDEQEESTAVAQHGNRPTQHALSHSAISITDDIRDVIRRYGSAYDLQIWMPTQSVGDIFEVMLPVSPVLGIHTMNNLLTYYAWMYRAWSGSLRYKFVFSCSSIDSAVVEIAYYPDESLDVDDQTHFGPCMRQKEQADDYRPFTIISGNAGTVINPSDVRTFEVEIPFNSMYHHLYTMKGSNFANSISNALLMNGVIKMQIRVGYKQFGVTNASYDRNVPMLIRVYIAAGDDFNFHFPIPLPPMDSGPRKNYWTVTDTIPGAHTYTTSSNLTPGTPPQLATIVEEEEVPSTRQASVVYVPPRSDRTVTPRRLR